MEIKPGRPRLEVNFELVLRLRDVDHLGWSRGAMEYRRRTQQWISKDTFKRRYEEAHTRRPQVGSILQQVAQWKLEI